MYAAKLIPLTVAFSLCAACANWNAVTKKKTFSDDLDAVFIDAKQRVVFARSHDAEKPPKICAEPSPDALSVLAASGGVDVTTPKGINAGAQGTLSEAAGSIGLRTQSIQLMRDAMFRICEGYANGSIGEAEFETLHRRFQQSMVTILAVEQLTGAVRPPALILAAGAGAASETIFETTANTRRLKEELDSREQELAENKEKIAKNTAALAELDEQIKKNSDKQPTAEQKAQKDALEAEKSTLEEDLKNKEKAVSDARDAYQAADDLRQQAVLTGSSSGGGGALLAPPSPHRIPKEAAIEVAKAVTGIVEDYNNLVFMDEVCTTLFTTYIGQGYSPEVEERLTKSIVRSEKSNRPNVSLFEICVERMDGTIAEAESKIAEANIRIAEADAREKKANEKEQKAVARADKAEKREKDARDNLAKFTNLLFSRDQKSAAKEEKAEAKLGEAEAEVAATKALLSAEKAKFDQERNALNARLSAIQTNLQVTSRTAADAAAAKVVIGQVTNAQNLRNQFCRSSENRNALIGRQGATKAECEEKLSALGVDSDQVKTNNIVSEIKDAQREIGNLNFSEWTLSSDDLE